ncbi:MAG: hypothetical protein P0S96_05915 [Simkaniaceae bacterium]|nr:hypothetical protein [Candidatus Sacchlamyda saccharinae]
MARVTGVGKGPEFPKDPGPKLSSKLAANVAHTDTAAKNTWLTQGFADLKGRVTVGPPPGDRL